MDGNAFDFIRKQRVSVLGILQDDTSIHSATLHFAHTEHPPAFYFLTDRNSRKCTSLLSGKAVNASLVIGFREEEFATFQAEGTAVIVQDKDALEEGWNAYGTKYPERAGSRRNDSYVLLKFTPAWTRFSAAKAPKKFSSEMNK